MEITTTTTHELKWDFPEAEEFRAVITNGKITDLAFPDFGELTESCLVSTNEKYLLHIYKSLKELFQHLDQIRGVGRITPAVDEDHIEIKWGELGKILPYSKPDEQEEVEAYVPTTMHYKYK